MLSHTLRNWFLFHTPSSSVTYSDCDTLSLWDARPPAPLLTSLSFTLMPPIVPSVWHYLSSSLCLCHPLSLPLCHPPLSPAFPLWHSSLALCVTYRPLSYVACLFTLPSACTHGRLWSLTLLLFLSRSSSPLCMSVTHDLCHSLSTSVCLRPILSITQPFPVTHFSSCHPLSHSVTYPLFSLPVSFWVQSGGRSQIVYQNMNFNIKNY